MLAATIGAIGIAATTTGLVFALNYEGEGFCEHAKAWPGGTYLGEMHPYYSEFYREAGVEAFRLDINYA